MFVIIWRGMDPGLLTVVVSWDEVDEPEDKIFRAFWMFLGIARKDGLTSWIILYIQSIAGCSAGLIDCRWHGLMRRGRSLRDWMLGRTD
jgi:hypothetical protein